MLGKLWKVKDDNTKEIAKKGDWKRSCLRSLKERILNLLINNKKYKWCIFSIIFITGILFWIYRVLVLTSIIPGLREGSYWCWDFRVYYDAVNLYLNNNNIYGKCGYLYPPLVIVFLLPINYLTFSNACLSMALLNIFLLVSTTIIISKILQYYGISLSNINKILIFTCIVLFYPVSFSLDAGQMDILILFLLTLFYYYIFVKRNTTAASIFLGIATVIKIWPIILVFLSNCREKAKGLAIKYFSVIGFLAGVSILIFGVPMHIKFLSTLTEYQEIRRYSSTDIFGCSDALAGGDASISNTIYKLLGIFDLSTIFYDLFDIFFKIGKIIFILCIFYYLYKLSRNRETFVSKEGDILAFSLLIISVLIIANPVHEKYITYLVLPYILFLFVLELSIAEKLILFSSMILCSFQEYITFFANICGGMIRTLVYIASPSTIVYLLFFVLVLYRVIKAKRGGFFERSFPHFVGLQK